MRAAFPALSVTRPWPTFIMSRASNRKTRENRTWTTTYRGYVWLHAAKSWQGAALDFAQQLGAEIPSWSAADYPAGIVGLVHLVSICDAHMRPVPTDCDGCGDWAAFSQFHWELVPELVLPEPVPCNGALKLWMPDDTTLAAIAAQGVKTHA